MKFKSTIQESERLNAIIIENLKEKKESLITITKLNEKIFTILLSIFLFIYF